MDVESAHASKRFVEQLVNEGRRIACDDSCTKFNDIQGVPHFYDEEKFKRGQRFFHKHIFAMFIAKFTGLMAILAIPSIRNVLIFTKMSNTPLSSYRRYLSTLFHMYVWYNDDFKPGSNSWNSIIEVRNKHNLASKRHCTAANHRISQFDMVVTQFGFMGFILCRPKMIGIHSFTDDELEGFIHLWRSVGDMMGIEDRFNLCRGSIEETKANCEELLETVLKPEIEKLDPNFVNLSTHLVSGMWCMQPLLQIDVFLAYLLRIVNKNSPNNNNAVAKIALTTGQSMHLWFIANVISTIRFWILRMYHNAVMRIALWLMENFPFLAYYKFGKANSHVTILKNQPKQIS